MRATHERIHEIITFGNYFIDFKYNFHRQYFMDYSWTVLVENSLLRGQ